MNSLGQRIKKVRKEKGLTQQELVDNNISRSMLSLIENGMSNPSMATLEHISKKLQKPVTYFLFDTEDINQKCESLILELEELIDDEQYLVAIDKTQDFFTQYLSTNKYSLNNRLLGTLYTLLGISYYNIKDTNSVSYLNNAIENLVDTDSPLYLCKAYNYLGLIKFRESDYKEMEKFLIQADTVLKTITLSNIHMKLNISYNLALAYYRQHKFLETIKLINKVFSYCNKYDLYYNYGEFNILAALSYKNINKLDNAIECNLNSINYYKLTKKEQMMYRCYINLSILYRIKKNSYDAIYYINEAIKYFETIGNLTKRINAIVEKIITLFILNSDSSLIQDLINVTINDPNINNVAKGELFSVLGTIELRTKNYNKALELFKSSEELVLDHINSEMNIFIYMGLHEVYKYQLDFYNSDFYYNKAKTLLKTKPYYNNLFSK